MKIVLIYIFFDFLKKWFLQLLILNVSNSLRIYFSNHSTHEYKIEKYQDRTK